MGGRRLGPVAAGQDTKRKPSPASMQSAKAHTTVMGSIVFAVVFAVARPAILAVRFPEVMTPLATTEELSMSY